MAAALVAQASVSKHVGDFEQALLSLDKAWLCKEIELVVTGGDTELDKSMVELIGDPLMHLVRNSLDHGIETPAERVAAGKPAQGRLGLNAYHEAGAIIIEVSDDGKGLVRERIVKRAAVNTQQFSANFKDHFQAAKVVFMVPSGREKGV